MMNKMDPDKLLPDKVRSSLDALGIRYTTMACDPDFADTAAFCEKYGIAPEASGNTILVASKRQPKQYSACLALATTKLDVNHAVRRLMGTKRLSFANAEETVALTGMMVGGVTLFGLPDRLPIYVDSRIMQIAEVVLGGGNRSSKIRLAPGELTKLPQMQVVSSLAIDR